VIIVNLHLIIVWQSRFIEDHPFPIQIFGWILSIAMTLPPIITKSGSALPAVFCMVSEEASDSMFFGPQAVLATISVVLHSVTAAHIFAQTRKSLKNQAGGRWIRSQISLQWRAILLTIVFLTAWGLLVAS
jgi:hypothetical protein